MKPRFNDIKNRGMAAVQKWMRDSTPDEIKIVYERIDNEIFDLQKQIDELDMLKKGLIPLPEWYWSNDNNAPDTWREYRGKEDEV